MKQFSISPQNIKYEIPDDSNRHDEIIKLQRRCDNERRINKKIVVIQGLGFVGSMMAAVIADCEINTKSPYFVIGVDLPLSSSFWKIPLINAGQSPFQARDANVNEVFNSAIKVKNNLIATWVPEAYHEADIIVVDINLDVTKTELGKSEESQIDLSPFERAIEDVGKNMNPDALLLIETTVPPGSLEFVIKPIIEKCFNLRGIDIIDHPPLIAHSYERVTPGAEYVQSIKGMRRTYSALSQEASNRTKEFLSSFINTTKYPLWELQKTTASEVAKVLENSYRATNIAFIYEWTLFAEDIGINLFDVVNSIKVRKGTHDNMMFPGFGVGGYCLTKDSLLAQWSSKNLFNRKETLGFSLEAINVNDLMPHHTFDLLMKGLGNSIKGKKIAILGASYRKDVDDTRNSPSITLWDDIIKAGGVPFIHDPFATVMDRREDIKIDSDLYFVINNAAGLVFAVNHQEYIDLSANRIIKLIDKNACIVDAFDVLTDDKIGYLKQNYLKVLGVGKGHIKYI
jgi:nucleotide sugar dehydrogenase